MAGPASAPNSGLRRPLAVAALLVTAAALLTGSPAAGSAARPTLRVLQFNLCDSGIAGCYTGRAVAEAAAAIRATAPAVVTLNEICEDDVRVLARAFGGARPIQAFQAAGDRRTGTAFRCRNGQPYGIGLLANLPGGSATSGGIYPMQDVRDPEERAWLCVHAARRGGAPGLYACTTHLAATSRAHALAQCRYLLGTAIPAMGGSAPTVLGGDLNLRSGGSPDVAACVPAGYLREDDGAVQHVLANGDFTPGPRTAIAMNGTTDHPGLLVTLTMTPGRTPLAAVR
ncbi:MAG: hypothetical protein JWO79_4313 [Actinomycetia bacterium]|nr:hypothetical protein [Actinomycetes bacterium]